MMLGAKVNRKLRSDAASHSMNIQERRLLFMAGFFDKMGAAISSTANDLSDKAKEMSEVTALKGQIRSQDKIVENMYLEIGRNYYDSHKDNMEDEYAAQMQNITTAKQTAERLRDDIDIIKAKN